MSFEVSIRCDGCERSPTLAEIPHLFKRGVRDGELTLTSDVFLCSRCHRGLGSGARIHWVPLAQLFED